MVSHVSLGDHFQGRHLSLEILGSVQIACWSIRPTWVARIADANMKSRHGVDTKLDHQGKWTGQDGVTWIIVAGVV